MSNKKFVFWLWISSLFVILISIVFYLIQFSSNKISDDPERWAQFGDYLGGVLGTLVSILNFLVFVYLSIRLVTIEEERNKWTIKELVRPYADLVLDKNMWNISITIHNIGLGPMIIKEIKILNSKNEACGSFENILNPNSAIATHKFLSFTISENHCAIGKEKELEILNISGDNSNQQYISLIKKNLAKLKEHKIEFTYYDMYGKEIDTFTSQLDFHV
ncbi:hypothetical protein ACQ9BO_00580 [Flavobacterium sp. P21]|uniref:hypothetical protein n=1 Tax=Flavobacterium sp. P21 TaxID=3423948 RepID=UPI003D66B6A4